MYGMRCFQQPSAAPIPISISDFGSCPRCPVGGGQQRQRPQNSTSAPGDAIWGAHRCNYIHGQFGGFFFAPQIPPPPRCTPVVVSTKLTSRLSLAPCCMRGAALLLPHPSGAPAGVSSRGLHPQEVLPGRLPGSIQAPSLRGTDSLPYF
jgi:hypothetical protein